MTMETTMTSNPRFRGTAAPHATASYRRLKPREDHADDQLSEELGFNPGFKPQKLSAEHQTMVNMLVLKGFKKRKWDLRGLKQLKYT